MAHHISLICFMGIDGSGKSTQAELLIHWLKASGIKALYVWSGGDAMGIRKFLLYLSKKLVRSSSHEDPDPNHKRPDSRARSDPYEHQSRRSKLMRFWLVRMVWSFAAYIEHLMEINRVVNKNIQDGYLVVCDRYRWDSLIELAVLNDQESKWLVNRLNQIMWRFIPRPAMTFLIDVPPEEALKRALQRNYDIPSLEHVEKRAKHYQWLAKNDPSVNVIDGCRDVASIQDEILGVVKRHLEEQGAA